MCRQHHPLVRHSCASRFVTVAHGNASAQGADHRSTGMIALPAAEMERPRPANCMKKTRYGTTKMTPNHATNAAAKEAGRRA
jgi:hypothetical protein